MIPKHFIQELLTRLDVVDVIEQYLPLKKAGGNYVACCPFHNEKSPSFTVSPSKQFYHCFGCGAHGTAISFVMEHSGLGFIEAVETLAEQIGVAVPREQNASNTKHKTNTPDLYETMLQAARYYKNELKQSARAIEYLKKRGVSGEIAARFGLGFSPEGRANLKAAFPDYDQDSLIETGLVIESDDGRRYDRFRDRIMFPIVNTRNQLIGFGGRILDKGEPKYLNSPETVLFEKGRELYGLYQAQKAIRTEQVAMVVEGYMDVIALAQHGIDFAVATLGTAATSTHIQKLFRITDHICFCFDGDKAGQKAAWRALEHTLPQLQDGKRVSFLFLPEEHDPDSFVREQGADELRRQISLALPLSSYLLQNISDGLDLKTAEGRDALLHRAKPLLLNISSGTASLLLRKEVAALAGIDLAELESLYKLDPTLRRKAHAPKRVSRMAPSANRLLLQCLIAQPELGKQLSPENISDEDAEGALIVALLHLFIETNYQISGPALTQHFQQTRFAPTLANVEAEMLDWGEEFDVNAEFNGLMNKLNEQQKRAQFQLLQDKVSQQGLAGLDDEERKQYLMLLRR